MQAVAGRRPGVVARAQRTPRIRARQNPAAAASLLRAATGLSVPSLAGIPAVRTITLDAGGYELARAMLRAGVADPDDWAAAAGNALTFIELSVARWIRDAGGAALAKHYDFTLQVVDDFETVGLEGRPARGIAVALYCSRCRTVACANAVALLESVHAALPVTFYQLLTLALHRVVSVYSWYSTQGRMEMEAEGEWEEFHGGESDSKALQKKFEAFVQEHATQLVPDCMRRRPLGKKRTLELLAGLPSQSTALQLVQAAAAAYDHAVKLPANPIGEVRGFHMTSQLPALVFHMSKDDEIIGCCDADINEFWQYCEEPGPTLVLPLPTDSASTLNTTRARLQRAVEVLLRVDAIADMIERIGAVTRTRAPVRRRGRALAEVLA